MTTSITTIQGTDVISTSRTDINNNFASLNTNKIETSVLDTDNTLSANLDTNIPSQKAVRSYVDANVNPTGRSWNEYAVDAVGTDSYAITLTGVAAYVAGQTFKFKAGTANTGACTLNINGLGAKTIKKNVSTDLATGDILINQIVTVIYDGTNMQMVSPIYTPIFTNGTTTKNSADASTTQNIAHGLGVIPRKIRIYALSNTGGTTGQYTAQATTIYNGTTQSSVSLYDIGSTNTFTVDTTFTLNTFNNPSNTQTGVITFDATNIIITWTKTGSPTGTYTLLWEAQY